LYKPFESIIQLAAISFLLMSCSGQPSKWSADEPFTTQIVAGNAEGSVFKVVTLKGVQDQKTLRGQVVEFFLSPGEKGNQLVGQAPVARFIQGRDGVHIPADVLSLQMVTLYHHMQSLKEFEEKLSDEAVGTWPRKIGLQVNSKDPDTRYNNAFYNQKLETLYFVPYTDSSLPIPLNPGVIAHEYFHSYFAKFVLKPLAAQKKVKRDLYTEYVLKSLNEGLADTWGWIYTGDPDFLSLSLPRLNGMRKLESWDIRKTQIKPEAELKTETQFADNSCEDFDSCEMPMQDLVKKAYENGTVIAQLFKDMITFDQIENKKAKSDSQIFAGRSILELLEQIKKSVDSGSLSLENTVLLWSKLLGELSNSQCEVLKSAISTDSIRDQICSNR